MFLRSRDPKRQAFEKLVNKIFGLEPYKKEAKALIQAAVKRFTDFRNKYNDAILFQASKLRATNRQLIFLYYYFNDIIYYLNLMYLIILE